MSSRMEIVDAPRPDPDDEDRVLLAAFRAALSRISVALKMPGTPDLTVAVPEEVERRLGRADPGRAAGVTRSVGHRSQSKAGAWGRWFQSDAIEIKVEDGKEYLIKVSASGTLLVFAEDGWIRTKYPACVELS